MRHEASGVKRQGYGLKVWEKAMDLVEQIYTLSARFPRDERFGLTTQLRRASVSVPSNIAEGYARGGGDYGRFVDIAQGSLAEIETQLELALRLGFVAPTDAAMTTDLARRSGPYAASP